MICHGIEKAIEKDGTLGHAFTKRKRQGSRKGGVPWLTSNTRCSLFSDKPAAHIICLSSQPKKEKGGEENNQSHLI